MCFSYRVVLEEEGVSENNGPMRRAELDEDCYFLKRQMTRSHCPT